MRTYNLDFDQTSLIATEYDTKSEHAGDKTEWTNWYSTDYLDLSGDYALVYNLAAHKYLYSLAFFDENKNFISGESVCTTSRCATLRSVSLVPENAVYARFIQCKGEGGFKDSFVYGLSSEEDLNEYQKQHPRAGMKIALIGDSLTEGDQGTNPPGGNYMTYRNYPFYLSEALDCAVLNFGHCGYTAESYLGCLQAHDADISDADLILVMLGTNAGLGTKLLQQKYRTILKLVERDKKEGARIVLVTPPHATEIAGKPNYGYAPNVTSAVEYILSYAPDAGYPVINAYEGSPIREENEQKYQPIDGLHMNESGYKALAEFIAAELVNQGLI